MTEGINQPTCEPVPPGTPELPGLTPFALDEMAAAVRYNRWIGKLVRGVWATTEPAAGAGEGPLDWAEFGAGTGTLSHVLCELLDEQGQVHMWEPYLRLLRRSHVIPTPRVLDAWPSTPSFDVVFSSNVIEHIAVCVPPTHLCTVDGDVLRRVRLFGRW